MKALVRRARAHEDVRGAVEFYLTRSEDVAMAFVAELERAFDRLQRPGLGSPRYGVALDLPGLRVLPLRRFAHLIFYVELETHVDVWRVLHGHRDIPAWLLDD